MQKNSDIPVTALFEKIFYAGRYHFMGSSGFVLVIFYCIYV
jgi:hypothetical protein